jgi:alkylation response protein AidB-like acyl-CoA dehydrogenase
VVASADTASTTEEARVRSRLDALLAEHDPATTPEPELRGHQFDAGLAWVHFPEGRGGLGVSPKLQKLVDDELRARKVPSHAGRNPIGLGMAAPTIVAHGTDEQQDRYLRPLFVGEEVWCQLFSEPGAGSDVAGLATLAVRDGDEWVVNGQKVWTTLAHVSRFGLLLARTDPDVPKHRGLTYFVLDLHAPGVEVRPLRQLTGDAEFNEVYLTDARIPDRERLGEEGHGWNVAITTLMNERVSLGGQVGPRGSGAIAEAVRIWRERQQGGVPTDPVRRDQLVQLWMDAEVLRLTSMRAAQLRAAGTPGPEGSMAKLAFAELNQRVFDLCVDLLGPAGMLYDTYELRRPVDAGLIRGADPRRLFLRCQANTIEGGTSNVMRNIAAERVLGLPGEPRTDRDGPWSEVPRS